MRRDNAFKVHTSTNIGSAHRKLTHGRPLSAWRLHDALASANPAFQILLTLTGSVFVAFMVDTQMLGSREMFVKEFVAHAIYEASGSFLMEFRTTE